MGLFVFNPDTGCTPCPDRATCTEMCPALKKYLGKKFRAHNSPKHELWGDLRKLEEMQSDPNTPKKTRMKGLW